MHGDQFGELVCEYIGTYIDKTYLQELLHRTIFISLLSLGSSHS